MNDQTLVASPVLDTRISSEWQEGTGPIVQDEALRNEALAALQRKYGWQLSLAMLISQPAGDKNVGQTSSRGNICA